MQQEQGRMSLEFTIANATNWDFQGSVIPGRRYWEHINIDACGSMINEGLKIFSRKVTLEEAWDWVFHQNGGTGYIEGQKIAIKLNWNDCWGGVEEDFKSNQLVSNIQLVRALIESLLANVPGIKPENLLVGDPSRTPYNRIRPLFPD